MPEITHVIFDFDGVLVDSENGYTAANSAMLSKYGKTFTLEMKLAMMGTKKSEAIQIIRRMAGIEEELTYEEYESQYDVQIKRFLSQPAELPGADKIIRHLDEYNIPMAICTGSDEWEFKLKTEKLYQKWMVMIPVRVLSGSDPEVKVSDKSELPIVRLQHGKPSPDPYKITLQRLSPETNPQNVLVFEDSINGVKSALAAGMHCIMVPQPQFLDDASKQEIEKLRHHVDEILDSLEQFQPEKYGLPPF